MEKNITYICLSFMDDTLYLFVNRNIFTLVVFLTLMHSGVLTHGFNCRNGVEDNRITLVLDASAHSRNRRRTGSCS